MAKYLLRKRLPKRHQENRPVDRMETDNILSDQVEIRRPIFLVLLCAVAVTVITDTGDIVCQRIQPYIDHMLIVKIDRDPPLKGGSGHAQILQSRQQEIVHHFVFPGHRLDKFRMSVDMLNQSVSILAHFKEVSFLLCGLHLSAAVGAFPIHKL